MERLAANLHSAARRKGPPALLAALVPRRGGRVRVGRVEGGVGVQRVIQRWWNVSEEMLGGKKVGVGGGVGVEVWGWGCNGQARREVMRFGRL